LPLYRIAGRRNARHEQEQETGNCLEFARWQRCVWLRQM
jgi:hypothetical protein